MNPREGVDGSFERLKEYPGTEVATLVLEGAGVLAVVILALYLGADGRQRSLNLLAALVGASFGWALAVISSPYSDVDSARFTTLAKTVSLFGSGYLISKLDKVFDTAFKPEVFLSESVIVRTALLIVSFLVIGMGTLSSRLYFNQRRRKLSEALVLRGLSDSAPSADEAIERTRA